MWLNFNNMEQTLNRRKNQVRCERCKIRYKKDQPECPHCFGIDDELLIKLLEKRKKFRLNIAKTMVILVLLIIAMLFLMNR